MTQIPSPTADTLAPGRQLGRYQIVRLMGQGGMAAVYEGIHLDLKKRVAIKTLHPNVAASPDARARFLREGEAASRIQHPNVVGVTDVGTDGGLAYLVMEFLEGEDLASMLARTGALPIADAVDIMLPLVGAIGVAHEEGVVHRDLKPGNVFMARSRHGSLKPTVLDFGISKLSSARGDTLALTGTGATLGTPYYIAPEQVRSAAGADGRSDQYALGTILYECLTGRRAHQGETIYDIIRSVGEGRITPPHVLRPDTPPALERAVLRAMALEPERRFPTVLAFGRELLPFASPTVRAQWAPALAGGTDGPGPGALGPRVGQTVILPTPAPRTPARRAQAGRARSSREVGDEKSNTTLGASVGQVTDRMRRRSPVLLIASLALVAGGATAAYLMLSPTTRKGTAASIRPTVDDVAPTTAAPTRKPVASVRVTVTASPPNARFALDGTEISTGRVDMEIADAEEHTLTVSAPGYRPARFLFRDHAPPETVRLEPLEPAANAVPASSADVVPPPKGESDRRERNGGPRRSAPPHRNVPSQRVRIGVDPSGTPIVD